MQEDYLLSNLDCVTVKGKTVGIKVYELVGRKATSTLSETNMSKFQNEAMELYFKRDFEAARDKFLDVLDLGDHRGAQILKERCEKYIENPPPPDWDGSEKMNAKTFH